MRPKLLKNRYVKYLGIDRFTPGHSYPPDTITGDVENLELKDNSQDLIICLHVLEHVNDDRKSLSEMNRVLKPGGIAVFAFPFRSNQLTYEDPSIVDPDERTKAFGQRDHVRFYGEDVAERMSEAGFEVEKTASRDIWSQELISQWALWPDEVFFLCRKPGDKSALSGVYFSHSNTTSQK